MGRILTVLRILAALVVAHIAYSDETSSRVDFDLSVNMPAEMAKAQVKKFQAAVASRSCFQVAALTRFPLLLDRGGKTTWIDNRTAFCRYFPIMFDETRSQIIATQRYKLMSAGWRGLKFGEGEFWMTTACANDSRKIDCPESERRLWLGAVRVSD